MKTRSIAGMREKADRISYVGSGGAERKIALVGTADSGVLAPYEDPAWEIWGVSTRAEYVTRADRWFEIHRLSGDPNEWMARWRDNLGELVKTIDLYMLFPSVPGCIEYPYERITQRFGTYFMTSSFSWMMALAIDELRPADGEPVKGEIGIFGVDMEAGSEYVQQRAGFRHFLDLARAWGIGVSRMASSGMAYEPIPYPMWLDDPLINKLDKRQVEARQTLDTLERVIAGSYTMIDIKTAVLAEVKGKRRKKIEAEIADLRNTLSTMEQNFIRWESAEQEQQWLRDYLTT